MDVNGAGNTVSPPSAATQNMERQISSVRAQLLRGNLSDPRVVEALAAINRAYGAANGGNVNSASVSLQVASKIANEVAPAVGKAAESGAGTEKNRETAPPKSSPKKAPVPNNTKNENAATMTYQDSSSDPGASFKYPTTMTPAQAELLVPVHEQGHVVHEKAKAALNGQEVVSATISISRRWDPVSGSFVIVGGEAQMVIRDKPKYAFNTLPGAKVRSAYVNGASATSPALDLRG